MNKCEQMRFVCECACTFVSVSGVYQNQHQSMNYILSLPHYWFEKCSML